MGAIRRNLVGLGVLAGGVAVAWNVLRDARARNSVRSAASSVSQLANHFASLYVGAAPEDGVDDEFAAERNREWVKQQWRDAGY